VEPVMPELIIHNADNKGALGLNYMGLVPVTINAIQQQQAQIEDQQKRIAEQQQQIVEQQEQNRKLEERLAALEKLLSTIQPNTTDR
jgi:septal ring factor EnvC (AmiA/AmiB activator)